MYIISHTFRNSSLDYEQTIRKTQRNDTAKSCVLKRWVFRGPVSIPPEL